MNSKSQVIKFNDDSRSELLDGVSILADAVKITMGPSGMNVIIECPGGHPIVTKDGVTVAKSIFLKDKFKNLGVEIVKEASSRTADDAGDGTTTATVLSHAIFSEGVKMMSAGYSSKDIIAGINIYTDKIVENIKSMSRPIKKDDDIMRVATISANGEKEIGELITTAIKKLGKDGIITVEEARGFKSDLVIAEGMQINRGYLSPYFVTDTEKMTCELDNPAIFLCNKKLASIHEISSLLEQSLQSGRPILIVCEDLDGDAMQGLVINTSRGNLVACAIKAPGFGNARVGMMKDLAIILGCEVFGSGDEERIKNISLDDLGKCKKVSITRSSTVFVGSDTDKKDIDDRIELLKLALKNPQLTKDEESVIRIRISRLSGGIGIIRVGGATEGELIERKDRVDDALHATQAALEEGIIPGGGVALLSASKNLNIENDDILFQAGGIVVVRSCESPIRQIVENTGGVPEIVITRIKDASIENFGYDASNGEFGDMFELGIIDPTKVAICALKNAASAACTLLSAGCSMVSEEIDS